jgi:hypothetical protein
MLSSGLSTTLHSEQRMDHLVELAANEKEQMEIGEAVNTREEQAIRAGGADFRPGHEAVLNGSQPRMG